MKSISVPLKKKNKNKKTLQSKRTIANNVNCVSVPFDTPTPQKCESLLCLLAYHTFKKLKHANKSTCFTQVLFCRLALVMNSELNACPVWVVRRLQVSHSECHSVRWVKFSSLSHCSSHLPAAILLKYRARSQSFLLFFLNMYWLH